MAGEGVLVWVIPCDTYDVRARVRQTQVPHQDNVQDQIELQDVTTKILSAFEDPTSALQVVSDRFPPLGVKPPRLTREPLRDPYAAQVPAIPLPP